LTEKSESVDSKIINEVYSWANKLTAESRYQIWNEREYVWPKEVLKILQLLKTMKGGLIGLVGNQGVGKSSALMAIYDNRWNKYLDKIKGKGLAANEIENDAVRFKWRRQEELFRTLLDHSHELSSDFYDYYLRFLHTELKSRVSAEVLRSAAPDSFAYVAGTVSRIVAEKVPYRLCQEDVGWAEKKIGKTTAKDLRRDTWRRLLGSKQVILIDTPDYSKTDRRLMAKDLEEIYWLWDDLTKCFKPPNIVIAIQKEMFKAHFFFDKMETIELPPLKPKQLLEAYKRALIKTTAPFTEEALLKLAHLSRGIFRRFLRYIKLSLDHWSIQRKRNIPITLEIVNKAVTTERLMEDMERELLELFPKQSDLRLQAVQLLIRLSESGPQKQSQLIKELELQPYAVSRLLSKLEHNHYISRQRAGTDKIVNINSR
jgi:hypothetical protein